MKLRLLLPEEYKKINSFASHPLQSKEWGDFRELTGLTVLRLGVFEDEKLIDTMQMTLHPVPRTKFFIGYLPKSHPPTYELITELKALGKKHRCIFIQLEPLDVATVYTQHELKNTASEKDTSEYQKKYQSLGLTLSAHPLFTKFTFSLDLTRPEEELLRNMHPKTRYNIKIATKHEVSVQENSTKKAFDDYLRLTHETTERQKFYAHQDEYHKKQWLTLPHTTHTTHTTDTNRLSSHLLTATYKNEVLVAWIVFVFKDTLYYPYGASSSKYKEVMASNLMMWEAIKFGKKHNLKTFDMWGALGPTPDRKDSWFGFHNFKERYGGDLVEYVGSYDLIIHPVLYTAYKGADKIRWLLLRLR